jgi:ArsR family transcriptional regulator
MVFKSGTICANTHIRIYKGGGYMVDIFKALSDETRLRILSVVWDGEMCVCEIEAALGLTQSNASRHLTALKNAGILSSRKCAQWAYYKLNEEFSHNNKELAAYLTDQMRMLPGYDSDRSKAAACREEGLCQINDDKEKRDAKGK